MREKSQRSRSLAVKTQMSTGEVPLSRKQIMSAHVCSIPLLPITVAAKGAPTFFSLGVTRQAGSKFLSRPCMHEAGSSHTQASN